MNLQDLEKEFEEEKGIVGWGMNSDPVSKELGACLPFIRRAYLAGLKRALEAYPKETPKGLDYLAYNTALKDWASAIQDEINRITK